MSQDQKKYSHPLKKYFINRFLNKVFERIQNLKAQKILDIGCGEGFADNFLLAKNGKLEITGIDKGKELLTIAKGKNPQAVYKEGDIYNLRRYENNFDLVLVMEVLEHLKDPGFAVAEVKNIFPRAIYTVPREPWFSIFSLLSGSYLKTLGRHPNHQNFWDEKSFNNFLLQFYNDVKIESSFPWLIAVCTR